MFWGCLRVVFEVVLRWFVGCFEGCFWGCFWGCLRVVFEVVLRLFVGCFWGCFEVVCGLFWGLFLRLFFVFEEGLRVVFEVVLRLFLRWDVNGCTRAGVSWGTDQNGEILGDHGSHVPRPVIQLFLDLCQICQATRGRKSTQKIVHKPIIPTRLGNADRQTWLICRWYRITATSSSSTTRIVSASTSSCDHSRPRQQLRWQTVWWVSSSSTARPVSCTRITVQSSPTRR